MPAYEHRVPVIVIPLTLTSVIDGLDRLHKLGFIHLERNSEGNAAYRINTFAKTKTCIDPKGERKRAVNRLMKYLEALGGSTDREVLDDVLGIVSEYNGHKLTIDRLDTVGAGWIRATTGKARALLRKRKGATTAPSKDEPLTD